MGVGEGVGRYIESEGGEGGGGGGGRGRGKCGCSLKEREGRPFHAPVREGVGLSPNHAKIKSSCKGWFAKGGSKRNNDY